MSKKYEILTTGTITVGDVKLYRIRAIKDFGNVKLGELGGFIQSEANLSQNGLAWVYKDAKVYGNAAVYDNAMVYGNAWVYDNAEVYENAEVYGRSRVFGNAKVFGNAWVYGESQVYGEAHVKGKALVHDDDRIDFNLFGAHFDYDKFMKS